MTNEKPWTTGELAALQSLYNQERRIYIRDGDDEEWIFKNVDDFIECFGRTRRSVHGQANYLRSKRADFGKLNKQRDWTDAEMEQLKVYMTENPRRSNVEVAKIMGRSKQSIANKILRLKKQGFPCNSVARPLHSRGIGKHAPSSLERRTHDACGYWYGSAEYWKEKQMDGVFQNYIRFRVYKWMASRQRTSMGEFDTRQEADHWATELNEQALEKTKPA